MNNTQIKSVIFGGHFQVSFQLTNTFIYPSVQKIIDFFSKLTFKKKSSQLFSLRMMMDQNIKVPKSAPK